MTNCDNKSCIILGIITEYIRFNVSCLHKQSDDIILHHTTKIDVHYIESPWQDENGMEPKTSNDGKNRLHPGTVSSTVHH